VPKDAALTCDEIVAYCRAHLSKEKIPTHVFALTDFPRGPAGKVALPQLRQSILEEMAASRLGALARSQSGDDVGTRVIELAARVFKISIDELSVESEPENTAGWNSLAHIDFIVSLEAEFKLVIPPDEILSLDTLGDAVALVKKLRATKAESAT
jgi:long-chain acyl-CoA synthetase